MANNIYRLTDAERFTALAALHAKWGNESLARHYLELAEAEQ